MREKGWDEGGLAGTAPGFSTPCPSCYTCPMLALMGDFAAWLRGSPDQPATAFAAHLRLVGIHPFNDGNGRTARLLMNLILLRGGYPPIAVRPEDRPAYLQALQQAQAGQGPEAFDRLLGERLDATLEDYLTAWREAQTLVSQTEAGRGPSAGVDLRA